jgi:hypothetical protein
MLSNLRFFLNSVFQEYYLNFGHSIFRALGMEREGELEKQCTKNDRKCNSQNNNGLSTLGNKNPWTTQKIPRPNLRNCNML